MTVADRYVVRSIIGQGGMGQVLDVEHLALGRHFALKVLRLERWSDELVRRFNREARALGSLSTPRVAQVTDFGIDSQAGPFYVMELLEGETLEDRLERDGKIPVEESLQICAALCEALADVHEAGIVHRDLKPSNVGLPTSGPVAVKLLDFGLAASVDDAFLSRITQSQQILGSLPYMAPEQFNAAEPAITMDIYATGIVLFECLTGRLPFIAPSTAAMIHQILATPVPALPSDIAATPLLQELVGRLLAKAPEERFANARAAAQAIRDVGGGPAASTPATRLGIEPTPPAEAAERRSVGHMQTLMAESGTRLSGAPAEPAPAPSVGLQPTLAAPQVPVAPAVRTHGSAHPPAGLPGPAPYPVPHPGLAGLPPTAGSPVRLVHPPRPGMSWPVRILLATLVGLVFAGLTAVAVALGLTLIDDSISSDVHRAQPTAPEPVTPQNDPPPQEASLEPPAAASTETTTAPIAPTPVETAPPAPTTPTTPTVTAPREPREVPRRPAVSNRRRRSTGREFQSPDRGARPPPRVRPLRPPPPPPRPYRGDTIRDPGF